VIIRQVEVIPSSIFNQGALGDAGVRWQKGGIVNIRQGVETF